MGISAKQRRFLDYLKQIEGPINLQGLPVGSCSSSVSLKCLEERGLVDIRITITDRGRAA